MRITYPPGPPFPSGGIVLWHGTIANIPSGYVICDGNNSSPNLLARFVEGVADAVTDPGATGGATGKTTSGHQHKLPFAYKTATELAYNSPLTYGTGADIDIDQVATFTSTSGSFPSYLSESLTDSIADIRPLYYDVAFIMKT